MCFASPATLSEDLQVFTGTSRHRSCSWITLACAGYLKGATRSLGQKGEHQAEALRFETGSSFSVAAGRVLLVFSHQFPQMGDWNKHSLTDLWKITPESKEAPKHVCRFGFFLSYQVETAEVRLKPSVEINMSFFCSFLF